MSAASLTETTAERKTQSTIDESPQRPARPFLYVGVPVALLDLAEAEAVDPLSIPIGRYTYRLAVDRICEHGVEMDGALVTPLSLWGVAK